MAGRDGRWRGRGGGAMAGRDGLPLALRSLGPTDRRRQGGAAVLLLARASDWRNTAQWRRRGPWPVTQTCCVCRLSPAYYTAVHNRRVVCPRSITAVWRAAR